MSTTSAKHQKLRCSACRSIFPAIKLGAVIPRGHTAETSDRVLQCEPCTGPGWRSLTDFRERNDVFGTKVARRYVAQAAPYGKRFAARFAVPGSLIAHVRDDDGHVIDFATEEEAEVEAVKALIEELNSAEAEELLNATRRTNKLRRLTGPELAVKLAELDMDETFLAYIYGVADGQAKAWIDQGNVPHGVTVLLAIFEKLPVTIDIAEAITEAMTVKEEEPADVD